MDLKTLSPAFILGVLHALEPGHGRTAIVGYLIGQGGSWLPALALGVANALTHGAAIFLLAYVIQLGLTGVDLSDGGESLHQLSTGAGIFIIILSFWFLWREYREENCCEPVNVSMAELTRTKTLWQQVRFSFLIGLTGGLIPCSSALAMYLANSAGGKWQQGVYSIGVFSVGLALSVTLSTWLIVKSTDWIRFVNKPGFSRKILWLRFLIMLGSGLFLIFHQEHA
jgi:nickel/cobalt exporter